MEITNKRMSDEARPHPNDHERNFVGKVFAMKAEQHPHGLAVMCHGL